MKIHDDFFDHLDKFTHKAIFEKIEFIWDPLKSISNYIDKCLSQLPDDVNRVSTFQGLGLTDPGAKDSGAYVRNWIRIESPLFLEKHGIYLSEGTMLEPSAIIKGPCYIGPGCEIRQGAYIRGNVIVGEKCVIGHNTEVKNSIIMNHTEAGHFNYIGDSILGSYINLGAGAKLANVEFRSPEDKSKENFPSIKHFDGTNTIDSTLSKFGAILGDNVEVGCNAVICPGTLVAKENWIYPNVTLPKGLYPPKKLVLPSNRNVVSNNK
ncbi:MAG: glucose-1-phosphate thymidylyltransferase [Nitrospinales bacterium]